MPYPTGVSPDSRRINGAVQPRYVRLLHSRFPHAQRIADELLIRSKIFRDLVEEYGMCADALERISREDTNTLLLDRYTALRFELERALLRYMLGEPRNDDPP